jgi:hypothetical protein
MSKTLYIFGKLRICKHGRSVYATMGGFSPPVYFKNEQAAVDFAIKGDAVVRAFCFDKYELGKYLYR